MLHDKTISGAITTQFNQDLGKLLDHDIRVITANAHIEAMIKHGLVNINELQEHYTDWITESSEVAFMMGLQEGAKLIHELISGNCVKEFMRTWGMYTEDKYMTEVNINSHYSNLKNGIRNGVKIDG